MHALSYVCDCYVLPSASRQDMRVIYCGKYVNMYVCACAVGKLSVH